MRIYLIFLAVSASSRKSTIADSRAAKATSTEASSSVKEETTARKKSKFPAPDTVHMDVKSSRSKEGPWLEASVNDGIGLFCTKNRKCPAVFFYPQTLASII